MTEVKGVEPMQILGRHYAVDAECFAITIETANNNRAKILFGREDFINLAAQIHAAMQTNFVLDNAIKLRAMDVIASQTRNGENVPFEKNPTLSL